MDHPHGQRTIVRPRLFDAQILEVPGEIRRAGRSQDLGDGEIEGVGQLFQVIHADIYLPALDLADVRPVKPRQLSQDLLRPAAGEAQTTSRDGLVSREPGRRERPAQLLREDRTDTGGSFLGWHADLLFVVKKTGFFRPTKKRPREDPGPLGIRHTPDASEYSL